MPVDRSQITTEVLENILRREIFLGVRVFSAPKMGKVRTVYDVGNEQLVLVSSDNLSTHDVVHRRQVFAKGENLDAISSFYFNLTRQIIQNHFIRTLGPNAWLVHKAKPILVEMVFRQYLTGSGWKDYHEANGQENGAEFCGVHLRPGYRKNEKLDELVFTPTGKGQVKDFPIPEFQEMVARAKSEDRQKLLKTDDPKLTPDMIRKNYQAFRLKRSEDLDYVTTKARELYAVIYSDLKSKGHLLADTKWEFGYLPDGTITLIDECVTPDSSRFWNASAYQFNPDTNEFIVVQDDKQHFRDHIEKLGLHQNKEALANYWMPDDVLIEGVSKYCNIRETITGTSAEITTKPRKQAVLEALVGEGFLN